MKIKTSNYLPPLEGEHLRLPKEQYEEMKKYLQSLLPKGATFRQNVDLLSQCFFALFPDNMPEHAEIATIIALELNREQHPCSNEGNKNDAVEAQLLTVMDIFRT